MNKLNPMAVGLALGITWAAVVIILGFSTMFFDYGTRWMVLLSTVYIGYMPTLTGSIVGGLWAFVDAFIGGYVIAWLYNKFS